MHKLLFILTAVVLMAFAADSVTYKADTRGTNIHWYGKKTTGQHDGEVTLKSGTLQLEKQKPVKAEFVIDMSSITCTDIADPKSNLDFVNHLKDKDFFNTAEFPEAVLKVKKFTVIEKAEKDEPNYTLTADLTIKGITNEISFPAKLDITKELISANANITIDRTKWNVVYKSKTVFSTLGDKFIYDDVNFVVKTTFRP